MGFPKITYNGKTISFTDNPVWRDVQPVPVRSVQTTVAGATEVLTQPRVDVGFTVQFQQIETASLLVALQKWWQWAQQGQAWRISLDGDRMVATTLSTGVAAGVTLLPVSSTSGVTVNQNYVLLDGPNYELVTVSAVGTTQVTVSAALDLAFGSGAVFRDEYYVYGVIRNLNQPSPIRFTEQGQTFPPTRFDLRLEFMEATTHD